MWNPNTSKSCEPHDGTLANVVRFGEGVAMRNPANFVDGEERGSKLN